MEVSESNFCLQLHFEWYASGPLVQQDAQAKSVLEIVQSLNVGCENRVRGCVEIMGKLSSSGDSWPSVNNSSHFLSFEPTFRGGRPWPQRF